MGCTTAEARLIGADVLWAISCERRDKVEFVARVSRDGKRVFRFRHAGTGKFWYALVNTQDMTCVTLLPPHYIVGREGKSEIQLKDIDL